MNFKILIKVRTTEQAQQWADLTEMSVTVQAFPSVEWLQGFAAGFTASTGDRVYEIRWNYVGGAQGHFLDIRQ